MMSTPKPLHDTSADRSTKVMGLALRDVNESFVKAESSHPAGLLNHCLRRRSQTA